MAGKVSTAELWKEKLLNKIKKIEQIDNPTSETVNILIKGLHGIAKFLNENYQLFGSVFLKWMKLILIVKKKSELDIFKKIIKYATPIFINILSMENYEVSFIEEMLFNWIQIIDGVLSEIRMDLNYDHFKFIINGLFCIGHYHSQQFLVEILIRYIHNCNKTDLLQEMLPERQLEKARNKLLNFDIKNFDLDGRLFLLEFNRAFQNQPVFSIPAKHIRMDDIEILKPMNHGKTINLWVDFNSRGKSISFYCDLMTFTKLYEEKWINMEIERENIQQIQVEQSKNDWLLKIFLKNIIDVSHESISLEILKNKLIVSIIFENSNQSIYLKEHILPEFCEHFEITNNRDKESISSVTTFNQFYKQRRNIGVKRHKFLSNRSSSCYTIEEEEELSENLNFRNVARNDANTEVAMSSTIDIYKVLGSVAGTLSGLDASYFSDDTFAESINVSEFKLYVDNQAKKQIKNKQKKSYESTIRHKNQVTLSIDNSIIEENNDTELLETKYIKDVLQPIENVDEKLLNSKQLEKESKILTKLIPNEIDKKISNASIITSETVPPNCCIDLTENENQMEKDKENVPPLNTIVSNSEVKFDGQSIQSSNTKRKLFSIAKNDPVLSQDSRDSQVQRNKYRAYRQNIRKRLQAKQLNDPLDGKENNSSQELSDVVANILSDYKQSENLKEIITDENKITQIDDNLELLKQNVMSMNKTNSIRVLSPTTPLHKSLDIYDISQALDSERVKQKKRVNNKKNTVKSKPKKQEETVKRSSHIPPTDFLSEKYNKDNHLVSFSYRREMCSKQSIYPIDMKPVPDLKENKVEKITKKKRNTSSKKSEKTKNKNLIPVPTIPCRRSNRNKTPKKYVWSDSNSESPDLQNINQQNASSNFHEISTEVNVDKIRAKSGNAPNESITVHTVLTASENEPSIKVQEQDNNIETEANQKGNLSLNGEYSMNQNRSSVNRIEQLQGTESATQEVINLERNSKSETNMTPDPSMSPSMNGSIISYIGENSKQPTTLNGHDPESKSKYNSVKKACNKKTKNEIYIKTQHLYQEQESYTADWKIHNFLNKMNLYPCDSQSQPEHTEISDEQNIPQILEDVNISQSDNNNLPVNQDTIKMEIEYPIQDMENNNMGNLEHYPGKRRKISDEENDFLQVSSISQTQVNENQVNDDFENLLLNVCRSEFKTLFSDKVINIKKAILEYMRDIKNGPAYQLLKHKKHFLEIILKAHLTKIADLESALMTERHSFEHNIEKFKKFYTNMIEKIEYAEQHKKEELKELENNVNCLLENIEESCDGLQQNIWTQYIHDTADGFHDYIMSHL